MYSQGKNDRQILGSQRDEKENGGAKEIPDDHVTLSLTDTTIFSSV